MRKMDSDKFILGSDTHFYQSFCGKLELKTYETNQNDEEMNVTSNEFMQEFNVTGLSIQTASGSFFINLFVSRVFFFLCVPWTISVAMRWSVRLNSLTKYCRNSRIPIHCRISNNRSQIHRPKAINRKTMDTWAWMAKSKQLISRIIHWWKMLISYWKITQRIETDGYRRW